MRFRRSGESQLPQAQPWAGLARLPAIAQRTGPIARKFIQLILPPSYQRGRDVRSVFACCLAPYDINDLIRQSAPQRASSTKRRYKLLGQTGPLANRVCANVTAKWRRQVLR